jgi:hypothetical protein
MILTDLGPLTAYRMHTPKWASAPRVGPEPQPMAAAPIDQARTPSTWRSRPTPPFASTNRCPR